jgi:hypothetical protein
VLLFLFKATLPFKQISANLLRAVFHHCGNFSVFRSTAALPFVSLLKEVLEKAVPVEAEKLAYVRRLAQTVLHSGEPLLLFKAAELLNSLSESWGGIDTSEYKADARDAVHAAADQSYPWEVILLKSVADERVITSSKRKAADGFTITELLNDIAQPERSAWEFSKQYSSLQSTLPSKKKAKIERDDDEAIDSDMLEDEDMADEDEIPDLSDTAEGDDDFAEDDDFGASLDEEEEEEESEDGGDDDEDVKKAKMLRKKFGSLMFVAAEDIEQYL